MKQLYALMMVLMLVMMLTASSAYAANITITKSGTEGGRELAQAVSNANTDTNGSHTINFAATVKSVTLNEELTIRTKLTINGNGATIQGTGAFRLFRITGGRTVFNRITFTRGRAIENGGAVEIARSSASAEFNNCTFFQNQAGSSGGAVSITEGGISSQTTFKHCTIAGNTADTGGGISLMNGAASVYASIILRNGSGDIAGDVRLYDTITSQGYTAEDVLQMNSDGVLELSEVKDCQVLKLSPASPAIDFLTTRHDYALDIDSAGTTRPQLYGYDLGAYEALPVAVEKVSVSGQHYIRVADDEQFTAIITPEDASRNFTNYPPNALTWTTRNTTIISVDNSGLVSALGVGTGYIKAVFHGWDGNGNEIDKESEPFEVRVGLEERQPPVITITPIAEQTMNVREHRALTPTVSITANGYPYEPEAGVNYELSVSPLNTGLVTATISGDSITLLAQNKPGSCDVRVTATTIPDGSNTNTEFHVVIDDHDAGRSSGGGGCEMSMLGLAGISALSIIFRRKINAE